MRKFLKASQAIALLFSILLSMLFYNNCSGPRAILVGSGTSLYTPKSNTSGSSSAASELYSPGGAVGASSLTSNPNIQGVFEGIRGDVILGWACIVKKAQSTKINILIDGAQFAEILTSIDNEPAISDATHCNAAYSKNRFFYRLKEDQAANLVGKTVTVYATDPTNLSQTAQLSASSAAATIGMRPLWYSRLPVGYMGSPIASPMTPALTGLWESTVVNADGSMIISGWACSKGYSGVVAISLYTSQNEFVKTFETNLQTGPSEAASISTACGVPSGSSDLRRFSTQVDRAQALQFQNRELRISLAEPFVAGIAYGALPRASGAIGVIPPPPATVVSGTAPGASSGSSGSSGTGGSGGSSGGGTSTSGSWSCGTPAPTTLSCYTTQHCPGAFSSIDVGYQSVQIIFNFSGKSGDLQTVATLGNTSASSGYTLKDISGLAYMCLADNATRTASWTAVRTIVTCSVSQELAATDVRCCTKERGVCVDPSAIF